MIEYTFDRLESIVKESKTYNEVLTKFERNCSGTAYKSLQKTLNEWNISTSHFLNNSEITKLAYSKGLLVKKTNDIVFSEKSNTARGTVKRRLLSDKIIPYLCCKCGQDDKWNGEKITLILDHINGINNDNRIENLRFLCPNCNATLKTHCTGRKGLENKPPKVDGRTLKKGLIQESRRKVKVRPALDVLKEDIKKLGYTGTGKKYGVSDNAIRKWIK